MKFEGEFLQWFEGELKKGERKLKSNWKKQNTTTKTTRRRRNKKQHNKND